MAKYQMDDLDRAILQSLEDDGRKAMREIARITSRIPFGQIVQLDL